MKALLTFIFILFSLSAVTQSRSNLGIYHRSQISQLNDGQKYPLVVHSNHPEFLNEIEDRNISYRSLNGNALQIFIGKRDLEFIAKTDLIDFIEPNYRGQALNDSMIANNRVEPLLLGEEPFKQAIRGKGVVVGFIDTGIDFTHPDFQDSTGKTRVLKIWEQGADTLVSSRVPGFGYGQVWDSSDINAGTCPHDDDILSHGTNVAGIAVGNGLALDKYYGVAGESDIIYVATDFSATDWLNTVADGVEFIFNEAVSAGKACVINISAGSYLGSHDGSDAAAQRIDSMIKSKTGRAVVAAAGNSGALKYHLGYQVTSDTNFTWFQYNASSFLGYGAAYFQLWADTSDFNGVSFSVGANLPGPSYQNRGRILFSNVSRSLNTLVSDTLYAGGNRLAVIQTYTSLQGDKYLLEVHIPVPDSNNYLFSFITTGNGHFDVWSDSWLGTSHLIDGPLPVPTQLPEVVNYKKPDSLQTIVSSFTCLPSVITVGNYINRNSYLDVDSVLQTFPVTAGTKSPNSSLGPNRKGHLKPDLMASGDYTLTANRLATIPLHIANGQSDRVALGGMHKRNGGTSMAAPVVSGLVALMFETCSDLSYEDALSALQQHAFSDTNTGVLPNYSFGTGKVDASSTVFSLYNSYSFSDEGLSACGDDTLEFYGPSNFQKYEWSTGDSTANILLTQNTSLSFTARDSSSCPVSSDTIQLTYYDYPVKPTVSRINSTTLESTLADSYQWFESGIELSGEVSQQLVISQSGEYIVEVSNEFCSTESDIFYVFLSVEELSEPSMLIYPNPVEFNFIQVSCDQCESQLPYRILSINGSLVNSGSLDTEGRIDISDLQKGLYILEIEIDSYQIIRQKFQRN